MENNTQEQENKEQAIKLVKQSFPMAICEPCFGGDPLGGFYVWNQPEWGSGSDLLGKGKTEVLAWLQAAVNVTRFNVPIHPDFK